MFEFYSKISFTECVRYLKQVVPFLLHFPCSFGCYEVQNIVCLSGGWWVACISPNPLIVPCNTEEAATSWRVRRERTKFGFVLQIE